MNLYPFERTVARLDVSEDEALENIDIGGPTMIRAAAKNHRYVAVVVEPESYDAVLAELQESGGEISVETRHWLANEAFAQTARYDAAISRWFGERYEVFPSHWVAAYEKFLDLSYGENPHQNAALYTEVGARSHVLSKVSKLHGRALSFNNVLDLDAARRLLAEFEEPACVIVKHNNPCGVAIAETVAEAYEKALACDPLSAYGGVIALNRPVDEALARAPARELHRGPDRARLRRGRRSRCCGRRRRSGSSRTPSSAPTSASATSSASAAACSSRTPTGRRTRWAAMEVATKAEPDERQWGDLLFAWLVARHVRSNAIVIAKDGATLGHRRGPDEPRRLGADRDRQGARGARRGGDRGCWRDRCSRRTRSSRSPTAPRSRSTPASRRSSSPAARSATPRSSPASDEAGARWS